MKSTFFVATTMACIASAVDLTTSKAEQDILAEIMTETEDFGDMYEDFTLADTSGEAFAEAGERTCMSTRQMALTKPAAFYSLVTSPNKYEDQYFKPNENSLFWKDLGEDKDKSAISFAKQGITWQRASQTFPDATLFGTGITANDINQGFLGNCWFLSSCAALAEMPGRVEQVFLNKDNEQNAAGIYGLEFYRLGLPTTIVIDDWLPVVNVYSNSDKEKRTLFARLGDDNALWGPLIEKALAKFHGNYLHLKSGSGEEGIRTLTGGPNEKHHHVKGQAPPAGYFAKLLKNDKDGSIMTSSSPAENIDGIISGHAYTFVGAHQLTSGTQLVRLRNPHGHNEYTGPWSDGSAEWATVTAKEKEDLHVDNKEDGFFYMEFARYYEIFKTTGIIPDVANNANWHSDKFLVLGDEGHHSTPSNLPSCKDCYQHKLTVQSTVAQQVYITVSTWDSHRRSKKCALDRKRKHIAFSPKDPHTNYNFVDGNRQLGPYSFTAGEELELDLHLDFKPDTKGIIPSDWSVVVWGDKGVLSVTHSEGLESASWPHIERTSGHVSVDAQKKRAAAAPKCIEGEAALSAAFHQAFQAFAKEEKKHKWVKPDAGCRKKPVKNNFGASLHGCQAKYIHFTTWENCENEANNKKEVRTLEKGLYQ